MRRFGHWRKAKRKCLCFQASAVKEMRIALFWFVALREVVIYYRRFGTIVVSFTCSETNHDFALFSESYLKNTSIQDCYLLALNCLKRHVISKKQLLFIVLRFWVSPLATSLPSVFVSSYEGSRICFTQLS
jgi:hypothetical protein